MTQARCMRCRKQIEILNEEKHTLKNRMEAMRGKCPVCGTKVSRILGKPKSGG
uniref:DUF5679 domain-containing protein n=1 Tax=viral metagenome TaxID=1070528 RepID=A0A6M3M910_9ZZZZ